MIHFRSPWVWSAHRICQQETTPPLRSLGMIRPRDIISPYTELSPLKI